MNENIWTPFFKKDNLWRFGTLTDLFKTFCGKLELAKVRNVHPEVTFFCGHFYLEVQIISKKAEFPEKQKTKKMTLLVFFWRVKLSQPRKPPDSTICKDGGLSWMWKYRISSSKDMECSPCLKKKADFFNSFTEVIKKWIIQACPSRLCKSYI